MSALISDSRSLQNPPRVDGGSDQDKILKATCELARECLAASNQVMAEHFAVLALKLLAGEEALAVSSVDRFLGRFDRQIRDISRRFLNADTARDQSFLWKITEECYRQVISPGGTLQPHHIQDVGDQYGNGFDIGEAFGGLSLEEPSRRKDKQDWIEFWIRTLHKAPGGPTLFSPTLDLSSEPSRLETNPRYLFRVFDRKSSGRNDENVMASMTSVGGCGSRIDLLEQEGHKVVEMLHDHLELKSLFSGSLSDNLVSWTSSLLFALQYAIYREKWQNGPSDVKICVLDTRRFPPGQFMQDLSLLRAYEVTAEQQNNRRILRFFRFRLGMDAYYNGEYLSQGAVDITDRSVLMTLKDLQDAGLFEMYPEFEDDAGKERWANRVIELRAIWSAENVTTDEDIDLALKVWSTCFNQFDPVEIASIILSFKNRKLAKLNVFDDLSVPDWAEKPVEVRRYWKATKHGFSNELNDAEIQSLLNEEKVLEAKKALRAMYAEYYPC